MTAIIAIQFCAIVYLFISVMQAKNERAELQAKLYQQMIDYIQPTKKKLEESAENVNQIVEKANTSLDISDSLNTQALKKIKR